MNIKETVQEEKLPMSPVRKKFIWIALPIWVAFTVLPLILIGILIGVNEQKYEWLIIVWVATVCVVGLLFLCFGTRWLTKKETEFELEHYAYLFKKSGVSDVETYAYEDREVGMTYTLTKEGVKAEWPEEGEQVFDDVKTNVRFLAWEDAEVSLATHNHMRRAHIALAIFPSFDSDIEQSQKHADMGMVILPMTEGLFAAIRAFGLDEKTFSADWSYLFYNPTDAMKQIVSRGRILTMCNKKTGKIFVDKRGNFVADNEPKEE